MIRTLLQVRIAGHGHHKVEMTVHELLSRGQSPPVRFYVFDRCLVARVGNARVPVLLLVQQRKFTLLVGKEDDLVIDHCIGIRNAVNGRDKIHGHFRVVHFYIGIGSIIEGSEMQSTSTRLYTLQRLSPIETLSSSDLKFVIEIIRSLIEVHGEIPVHVIACLGFVQETRLHPLSRNWSCTLRILTRKSRHFLLSNEKRRLFLASCVMVR